MLVGLCFMAVMGVVMFYLRYKTITVTFRDMATGRVVSQAILETNAEITQQPDPDTKTFSAGFTANPFLAKSDILLNVLAAGYRPGSLTLIVPRWQFQPQVDVYLEPTLVTGRVLDAMSHKPLANVTLQAGLESWQQITQTDKMGMFQFYHLWLNDPIAIQSPRGYSPTMGIVLRDKADLTTPLELVIEPTVTQGQAVNITTDEPLARVQLSAGYGANQQTVTTDKQGRFTFYRLVPEDIITLKSPEYAPFEQPVGAGQSLKLSLQPYHLQTTVWNSFTNQPMDAAEIRVSNGLTIITDAQGQADLSHLAVPSELTIVRPGYQTITLTYQGQTDLKFDLAPAVLQGRIINQSNGQPLPQATLYLGSSHSRADDNGLFTITAKIEPQTPLIVQAAGYQRGYVYLNATGVFTTPETKTFNNVFEQWLTAKPCATVDVPCFDLSLNPFAAKAIYVPIPYLGSRDQMLQFLDYISASQELNALVVDVKGDYGHIAWHSAVKLVTESKADEVVTADWLPLAELVTEAHKRNIYLIARFVVFKDDPLAHAKPQLAVVDKNNQIWLDGENLAWANPFNPEVWQYNIDLAQEVAAFGFDEINFDYIRFPSDGVVEAITYQEENSLETRTAAIRNFIAQMDAALAPYPIFISVDVFGLTVWVPPDNDMNIGQRVIDLTPHIDYLAPMVYPSTFIKGNLDYDDPSAEPYGVVYNSQLAAAKIVPPYVKVRPWLQAYWYDLAEMKLLRQGAMDANAMGWAWWNAGGVYDDQLLGVTTITTTNTGKK